MGKANKAHTATANRIAKRYGGIYNHGDGPDISTDELTIEVETTATIRQAVRRLTGGKGAVFVAVTNKDGVVEALRIAQDTRVGVMDPQGQIVKQSDPPYAGGD